MKTTFEQATQLLSKFTPTFRGNGITYVKNKEGVQYKEYTVYSSDKYLVTFKVFNEYIILYVEHAFTSHYDPRITGTSINKLIDDPKEVAHIKSLLPSDAIITTDDIIDQILEKNYE